MYRKRHIIYLYNSISNIFTTTKIKDVARKKRHVQKNIDPDIITGRIFRLLKETENVKNVDLRKWEIYSTPNYSEWQDKSG